MRWVKCSWMAGMGRGVAGKARCLLPAIVKNAIVKKKENKKSKKRKEKKNKSKIKIIIKIKDKR
jgi:hypothetical protein